MGYDIARYKSSATSQIPTNRELHSKTIKFADERSLIKATCLHHALLTIPQFPQNWSTGISGPCARVQLSQKREPNSVIHDTQIQSLGA